MSAERSPKINENEVPPNPNQNPSGDKPKIHFYAGESGLLAEEEGEEASLPDIDKMISNKTERIAKIRRLQNDLRVKIMELRRKMTEAGRIYVDDLGAQLRNEDRGFDELRADNVKMSKEEYDKLQVQISKLTEASEHIYGGGLSEGEINLIVSYLYPSDEIYKKRELSGEKLITEEFLRVWRRLSRSK